MADPKVLQKDLGASREEWAVIWPKLRNIMHLRAEVEATLLDATTSVGIDMMMLGAPGMPGGGNSLEGPAAQAGGSGAMGMPAIGGMFGNGKGPFAAPPVKSGGPGGMPGGMGGFGPPEGGGFGDMLNASEGNAVKALLLELQTLIADRSTPENQLKEKLETIRATRLKSKQALQSAETDVMLLLTTKQIAALMSLGYLD